MRLLTLARDLRRGKRANVTRCLSPRASGRWKSFFARSASVRGALTAPQLARRTEAGRALASMNRERGVKTPRSRRRNSEAPLKPNRLRAFLPSPRSPPVRSAHCRCWLCLPAPGARWRSGSGKCRNHPPHGCRAWSDATIALPGTVDLWNAKVVRRAMGAQLPACRHCTRSRRDVRRSSIGAGSSFGLRRPRGSRVWIAQRSRPASGCALSETKAPDLSSSVRERASDE